MKTHSNTNIDSNAPNPSKMKDMIQRIFAIATLIENSKPQDIQSEKSDQFYDEKTQEQQDLVL